MDETKFAGDVRFTLNNPDAHGKAGSVVAIADGVDSRVITKLLCEQIPEPKRLAVKEVCIDLSDSQGAIAVAVFPNAMIVRDVFHVMRLVIEGLEEMRLKAKREAVADQRREKRRFKKRLALLVKNRKRYREKHPKDYRGKKRGRKPTIRKNAKFVPEKLQNGETRAELLTRSKYLISMSYDKLTDSQKKRANILFSEYPRIKRGYDLVNKLRALFRSKRTKENAREVLREWYREVAESHITELVAAKKTIRSYEDEILNFFVNRSTNASQESFHSKIKGFVARERGITDYPLFLYRVCMVPGSPRHGHLLVIRFLSMNYKREHMVGRGRAKAGDIFPDW